MLESGERAADRPGSARPREVRPDHAAKLLRLLNGVDTAHLDEMGRPDLIPGHRAERRRLYFAELALARREWRSKLARKIEAEGIYFGDSLRLHATFWRHLLALYAAGVLHFFHAPVVQYVRRHVNGARGVFVVREIG